MLAAVASVALAALVGLASGAAVGPVHRMAMPADVPSAAGTGPTGALGELDGLRVAASREEVDPAKVQILYLMDFVLGSSRAEIMERCGGGGAVDGEDYDAFHGVLTTGLRCLMDEWRSVGECTALSRAEQEAYEAGKSEAKLDAVHAFAVCAQDFASHWLQSFL